MNIKVFQDALANVDDKYIEEAAVYAAASGESGTAYGQSSIHKRHPGLWKGLVIAACCIIAVSATVNIASGISHMGCGGASGAAKDSAYYNSFDADEAIAETAAEAQASGEISGGAAPEDIALGGNPAEGAAAYDNGYEIAEDKGEIAEDAKAIEEDPQAAYAYSQSAKEGFFSWLTESWTHILLIPGAIAAVFLIVFLILRAIMLRKRH